MTPYPIEIFVAQGEMTCLDCGETVSQRDGFCPRCRGDDPNSFAQTGTNLVPTLSYLRKGEYTRGKKEAPVHRLLARAAVVRLLEYANQKS